MKSVQQTSASDSVLPVVEAPSCLEEEPQCSLKIRLFAVFIFLLIGLAFSRFIHLPLTLPLVNAAIFSIFILRGMHKEISEEHVRKAIERFKQIVSTLPCLSSSWRQLEQEKADLQIDQKKQIDAYKAFIMHHAFSNSCYKKNLEKLIQLR